MDKQSSSFVRTTQVEETNYRLLCVHLGNILAHNEFVVTEVNQLEYSLSAMLTLFFT